MPLFSPRVLVAGTASADGHRTARWLAGRGTTVRRTAAPAQAATTRGTS
ncbi:hypothetical protein OG436_03625 [Streptomyces caniferus]|nr:hypothetical protein [Streptomyces caniferus]